MDSRIYFSEISINFKLKILADFKFGISFVLSNMHNGIIFWNEI
jgi:hypothetical protein